MQASQQAKKGLGKGLASLLPTKSTLSELQRQEATADVTPSTDGRTAIVKIPVYQIVANRQQPRADFNDDALNELAESIRRNGVLQPLLVTRLGDDRYELIAGERRLRASRLAGISEVPVIIKQNVDGDEMLELALIENVQRENLNAIEEAKAYAALMDQFGFTLDDVMARVGKSKPAVSNTIRLLQLPKVIQDDVVEGRMTAGHARQLLALTDLQEQLTVREQILQMQLSVRDVERIIQQRRGRRRDRISKAEASLPPQLRFISDEITKALGSKVVLKARSEKTGAIVIEYYSLQDLDRIYRKLTTS